MRQDERRIYTCVKGLPDEIAASELKRIRKALCCNGAKLEDFDDVAILIFQGDQREALRRYLLHQKIATEDQIYI